MPGTHYLSLRFLRLIDEYNSGSANADQMLHKLMTFTRELNTEEQRHISEQLSEEELAMFDLLKRPNKELSEKEKDEVKKVARSLLETLKREKLVLDWRKKQQAKANVQVTIDEMLDRLPSSYTREIYLQLCTEVFQHIYESYYGQGSSIYAVAS
jgi:type I restriction enzyme, R subunit